MGPFNLVLALMLASLAGGTALTASHLIAIHAAASAKSAEVQMLLTGRPLRRLRLRS
jgi:hypothetical protein